MYASRPSFFGFGGKCCLFFFGFYRAELLNAFSLYLRQLNELIASMRARSWPVYGLVKEHTSNHMMDPYHYNLRRIP